LDVAILEKVIEDVGERLEQHIVFRINECWRQITHDPAFATSSQYVFCPCA
jgi:hypothetical protein